MVPAFDFQKLRDRDNQEWQLLVDHFRVKMASWIRSRWRVATMDDCDDVISEVLMDFWRFLKRGEDPRYVEAVLRDMTFKTAYSKCAPMSKRQEEMPPVDLETETNDWIDQSPTPDDEYLAQQIRTAYWECFRALELFQQLCVFFRYQYDMTYHQIMEVIVLYRGIHEQATFERVRYQLSKGTEQMKTCLTKKGFSIEK